MSNSRIVALAIAAAIEWAGIAQAAEPTTGECLTASNASLKLSYDHKLLTERAQLLVCAAASCPNEIRKECLRRVDEVNAALPSVVFEVKDSAGNDITAVKLTMDGEVLATQLEGLAIPLDPGAHKFAFEAQGFLPFEQQFVIRESQKGRRELIVLSPPVSPVTPTGGGVVVETQRVPPPADATNPVGESKGPLIDQKTLSYIFGGVGVAGVLAGTIFGIEVGSKNSKSRSICPTGQPCTPDEKANYDSSVSDARTARALSVVGFGVGAAGLATGAILFFTARSANSTRVGFVPSMGPNRVGATLQGAW